MNGMDLLRKIFTNGSQTSEVRVRVSTKVVEEILKTILHSSINEFEFAVKSCDYISESDEIILDLEPDEDNISSLKGENK